jgi:hypothetical protein
VDSTALGLGMGFHECRLHMGHRAATLHAPQAGHPLTQLYIGSGVSRLVQPRPYEDGYFHVRINFGAGGSRLGNFFGRWGLSMYRAGTTATGRDDDRSRVPRTSTGAILAPAGAEMRAPRLQKGT